MPAVPHHSRSTLLHAGHSGGDAGSTPPGGTAPEPQDYGQVHSPAGHSTMRMARAAPPSASNTPGDPGPSQRRAATRVGAATPEQQRAAARRLLIVAVLTGAFMIAEFIGGALSNSLALISDAGHMFVDTSGLVMAALMARLAMKPADPRRTFGYRRAEVLGAFVNGTLLCGLVIFIVWEAVHRIFADHEPDVKGGLMLWIAVGGLAFNLIAGAVLLSGSKKHGEGGKRDLNTKAALLNIAGDALGSVGAILAGLAVLYLDWQLADAIVGLLVAALIAFNAVRLLRETLLILLEGVPRHLDVMEIQRSVATIDGIATVHDIHVWATAPGEETLTLHVVLKDKRALLRWDDILVAVNKHLSDHYGLHHNIIQPELREELHEEIQHL